VRGGSSTQNGFAPHPHPLPRPKSGGEGATDVCAAPLSINLIGKCCSVPSVNSALDVGNRRMIFSAFAISLRIIGRESPRKVCADRLETEAGSKRCFHLGPSASNLPDIGPAGSARQLAGQGSSAPISP